MIGIDLRDDTSLSRTWRQLIVAAARKLASADMVVCEESNENFSITEIGRIAARYYIRHASIEIFNKELRRSMSEADVLAMMSMSTEVNFFLSFSNKID